ncbi:MAG: pseudouridine synthase [archaeon GB-1867-097]|nr:pseudouridine synthase [Candidatus Culexmicrobium thermophilum]MCS7384384.1 pseudouridine synthase [Candidatus Culexmicrobium thermophilum]RLE56906.1 MAG: pseudouridine synthase [Candidatus Verstraetearchaeota archaeon]HDO20138.1 pseudouridine synthase [Candidatus Bathyarchaeota archaeon]
MNNIYRLRRIAEYQFGEGIGDIIFPDDVEIEISKRTGKIKRITLKGKVLATLRPRDGMIALTVEGAKKIKEKIKPPKLRVTVMNEVAKYIRKGRNVFAKHVKDADPEIRPGSEVIIVDEEDNLLAVGKAILNGKEMIAFKSGIAVKVRRGVGE